MKDVKSLRVESVGGNGWVQWVDEDGETDWAMLSWAGKRLHISGPGTLVFLPDADPPKEKRKECAIVDRGEYGCVCEDCGNFSLIALHRTCSGCGSHFTHTIPWAEFGKDC